MPLVSPIPSNWLCPASLEEAARIQRTLAKHVILEDQFEHPRFLGGMDVSNNLYDPRQMIYAAAVLLEMPNLELKDQFAVASQQKLPYMPGFLGFREAPALVEAFKGLTQNPDLAFIDGHGTSHPRGLGIASHIGVLLDIPTIGVAKTILVGKPEGLLGSVAGDTVPLIWKGKTLGLVLRTKANCNPLIISAGHKISLETALAWVLKTLVKHKLPEPTRQAHLAANACRKKYTH